MIFHPLRHEPKRSSHAMKDPPIQEGSCGQGLRYKASRKDKEVGSLSRRTDTDSQASQPGGCSGPQLGDETQLRPETESLK